MVHGIQRGGRWGGVYCAMGVHWYCDRVGVAGGVGGGGGGGEGVCEPPTESLE